MNNDYGDVDIVVLYASRSDYRLGENTNMVLQDYIIAVNTFRPQLQPKQNYVLSESAADTLEKIRERTIDRYD